FDIRDQYRPKELGALVPPAPARMIDHRPNRAQVIQSADVFVDAGGLIYSTDYNGGPYILAFHRRPQPLKIPNRTATRAVRLFRGKLPQERSINPEGASNADALPK